MFFIYWVLCDDKKGRLKALFFIFVLSANLSAYWILNTVLTFNINFKSIASIATEGIPLENIVNYALPIFRIFNFHYSLNPFTENTFSSVPNFYKIWYFTRFIFVIFLFLPAVFLKKNKFDK